MDPLVKSAPSNQIALDTFKDQWAHEIPIQNATTGKEKVCKFPSSILLAKKYFSPLDNFSVLELGPNECEITIGANREKVRKVISIECRRQAFLKCLVIKNLLKLDKTQFLLGNFIEYLKAEKQKFDLCLACGVLYHMTDPVELIELICSRCDRVIVATHYMNDNLANYDVSQDTTDLPVATWNIVDNEGEMVKYKGLDVRYFKNIYPDAEQDSHIVTGHGGTDNYSQIMELKDILKAFEHFGFEIMTEMFDDPDGPRGPHVLFAAKRKGVPFTITENRFLKVRRRITKSFKKALGKK